MPVEIIMPALELAQDTGKLVGWYKEAGELVRKGEPLLEIETDKVTVVIEAPATGVLAQVTARANDTVPVGTVIGVLLQEQETSAPAVPSPASPSMPKQPQPLAIPNMPEPMGGSFSPRLLPASPKARAHASRHGLPIQDVKGSGPNGAVVVKDVLVQLSTKPPPTVGTGRTGTGKDGAPVNGIVDYSVSTPTDTERMIAARPRVDYRTVPEIGVTISVDMSAFLHVFEQLKQAGANLGGPALTITALLAKLVGATLLKHPGLNAHLVGDELQRYDTVHLGIAVVVDDHLVVPVIRHAEQKTVSRIQGELSELTMAAGNGARGPSESKEGTFTLCDLGMYAIDHFTAVLNPPQVALLAVGAIQEIPVSVHGSVVLRPVMQMTLQVDHRAMDAAGAASYLHTLKDALQLPYQVLL